MQGTHRSSIHQVSRSLTDSELKRGIQWEGGISKGKAGWGGGEEGGGFPQEVCAYLRWKGIHGILMMNWGPPPVPRSPGPYSPALVSFSSQIQYNNPLAFMENVHHVLGLERVQHHVYEFMRRGRGRTMCGPPQAEMRISVEQREKLLTARRHLLRGMREVVYKRRTILAQLGLELISASMVRHPSTQCGVKTGPNNLGHQKGRGGRARVNLNGCESQRPKKLHFLR